MKVQRVRLPNMDQIRWIVLDDEFIPIQPICSYLTFLDALDRSPNTIRSTAHHLKLFWEYLRDERLCWTEMNVACLAAFIPWLRRSDTGVISIENKRARRTNAEAPRSASDTPLRRRDRGAGRVGRGGAGERPLRSDPHLRPALPERLAAGLALLRPRAASGPGRHRRRPRRRPRSERSAGRRPRGRSSERRGVHCESFGVRARPGSGAAGRPRAGGRARRRAAGWGGSAVRRRRWR